MVSTIIVMISSVICQCWFERSLCQQVMQLPIDISIQFKIKNQWISSAVELSRRRRRNGVFGPARNRFRTDRFESEQKFCDADMRALPNLFYQDQCWRMFCLSLSTACFHNGATTLSITTLRIMTLSITTLSTNDTQHNNALPLHRVSWCWSSRFIYHYAECHYAECRYAECRGASTINQSKIIANSQRYFGPVS